MLPIGLASVVTGTLLAAAPVAAEESAEPDCVVDDAGLTENSESAALELAAECAAEVLIGDSQSRTSRSFAQPDGSISSEFYLEPQWVPDDGDGWDDVDTTVTTTDDGAIQTSATVTELEFAAGGETEFVTATNTDGESVSLSWHEPLPAPEIDGSTVTYPEVMPDVDLEVYAGVTDFSYALVVKTPEAALNPDLERIELGLRTDGLDIDADSETDTAEVTDEAGDAAFSVSQPWMWDSSAAEGEDPELAAPMELEIDADSLTVTPDQEVLTDAEAAFPIYIDPQFTDSSIGWENAWSQGTGVTCGNNEMCTGRQTWKHDGAYGYWRTAMQFNGLQAIADRDVQQATIWIDQTHTGDAGGPNQTVRLYAMDYFSMSSTITWSAFGDLLVSQVASDSVPTSNTGAGEADRTITWADSRTAGRIQTLVDRGGNTATFAVVSGANRDQEDNQNYWRKLDASSARLTVWHAPLKPTKLHTAGASCSTSYPGPTIDTLTPTLKATAPTSLTSDNRVSFYVYESGKSHPNFLQQINFNDIAEGQTLSAAVSSGRLERGKTYRWQARAWDSDGSSSRNGDFTSYCYFRVNQLPNTPTDLSTEGLGCGTQSAPSLVTTTTPKLSSIPSDPDGGTVWARYRFYEQTGDNIKEWQVKGTSGVEAPTRVSSGLATADGLYRWRVITDDKFTASAAWSSYCWIKIDTTAPEPPDVAQVTTSPLPGDTVEFEFIGGSDVKGFEYTLDAGTKRTVSASTGQTKVGITPSTSSVDHVLQVWAVDAVGNTSSPTTFWFTTIEAQPAEAIGAWRLDGDLLDDAGEDALAPKTAVVYGTDAAGRSEAAAVFDGTGDSCLKADGPVVSTTDSFTIGAWVYAEQAPAAEAAVMDVTGTTRSNLKVILSSSGRWGIAAVSTDESNSTTTAVMAPAAATRFGTWTHLTTVYDAPAERLRVYLDGRLQASEAVPFEAWEATGRFSIGCGAYPSGNTFSPFTGTVDDAAIFQQALTGDQVTELMSGEAMPAALQAWYPLRGDGLDHSGRPSDLTDLPATPVWVSDQYGRASSALEFDGTSCPNTETVPVRTDEAFSVSAWARLDPEHANSHPRVFSFDGAQYFSVMAKYNANTDKWNVAVTEEDTAAPDWGEGAASAEVAVEEAWNQITVTVDPDNDLLQLFVNGELTDTGAISGVWDPWRASEFVLGCGAIAGSYISQWDGAISDVRVWRGVLDDETVKAAHVEQNSAWELGESTTGNDAWGANDLTFNGEYSWEIDRYNDCYAAYGLMLGGSGWAETAAPAVVTDESFTVAAWTRVDDLSDYRTIVAQSGTTYGAFTIEYSPEEGRFQLAMPQSDTAGAKWVKVGALENPVVDETTGFGKWYHLAAQVDLGAGVMRFYVDGVLQGETPVVDSPWQDTGPLTIGAAEQNGEMTNQMVGAIDQVQAWSGALDPLMIAAIAAEVPEYEVDPNGADCGGTDDPPPIDDL